MPLDHAKYRALRADVEAALAAVAPRHGLKAITLGKMSVDGFTGAWRAQVAGIPEGGLSAAESMYEATRRYHARALPELGARFTSRGTGYVVIGQDERGKRRIQGRRDDGRVYLIPIEDFANLFPLKDKQS